MPDSPSDNATRRKRITVDIPDELLSEAERSVDRIAHESRQGDAEQANSSPVSARSTIASGVPPPPSMSEGAIRNAVDPLKEQLLRTAADFDNFRKRAAKDRDDAIRYSNERLIKELLPIYDNLERALTARQGLPTNDVGAIIEGVELVKRNLFDCLKKFGVEEVPAEGLLFDPNLHEAMGNEISQSVPEQHIIRVCQPGYLLNRRLIRPALVVVSQGDKTST